MIWEKRGKTFESETCKGFCVHCLEKTPNNTFTRNIRGPSLNIWAEELQVEALLHLRALNTYSDNSLVSQMNWQLPHQQITDTC